MRNKTLTIVLALGVIASVGYFGTNAIYAEENNPIHQNLIQKIALKFNLRESDVEAVFEAVRDEKRDEMKKTREEKLSQAVNDGVITDAQRISLISKMQEHFEERGEERAEMQKWFTDNGIDETKLREYLRPEGKGMGMGRHN